MRADGRGNAVSIGSYVNDPIVLNMTTGSANTTLVANRHYRIWSSVDAFFKFGTGGVTATTSSHPLKAGLDTLHVTDGVNTTLAGVVPTGTGVLYISEWDVSQL